MKTHALLAAALFLAACAGQGGALSSGAGGPSGTSASGGGDGGRALNADVSDAVARGSTQGFAPSSSPSGR
ncbi:MAG TPA: hypothetical protein VJ652_04140 [Noviherbaspirillum sp.]|nr:hypothetical protein [Noviherbaspirillum sp.]